MKSTVGILTFLLVFGCSASAQKMNVEEVFAKSLDAVASADKRAKLKNFTAVGDAAFTQGQNHQRVAQGKSVFVSDAEKIAMAMTFPLDNYPMDRLTFDGKKLAIPFIRPGIRSVFGEFLTRNEEIVKERILGGVLFASWSVSDGKERLKRLSYSGMKKIDGEELMVLTYSARTGLGIRLFFDPKTFRHVRTEYKRVIAAQMGPTPELSARQNETVEEMWEEFSDHVTENGVTLPRSYKVRIANIQGGNTREFYYEFSFKTFYYDQQLDAQTFSTDIK